MADEAVTASETVNPTGHDAILVSNSLNLVNACPVSLFQGQCQNNAPSLVISAAREASKKRIEAASAAKRNVENLDAIVKAAELATEAVSHAGKIVTMGKPFSLSEVAESGPNSYWKVLKKGDDENKNKYITNYYGEVPEVHMNQHKRPDKDIHVTSDGMSPILELSRNMADDHVIEDNIIASVKHEDNIKPQKDIESRSTSYTLSSIKEGSYVEVLKDRGDLKKAWFSANVLRLKDGEALVSYTKLQSSEGSEPLKEWISIEAKDCEIPKVRIPHEMTVVQIEGTRKRRRAAAKDYTWSVGNEVPRLPLSANERTFSIGSSSREENKLNMVRTMRSGVEKGRPGVVFGVPKPGKKRKFMEVSKHYVSDRAPQKTNVHTTDSERLAKLLAPQGFRNKSKELQVVESIPRAIKSGKPPSIPSRTLARKDDSTSSRPNTAVSDTQKCSISNDENESGQQNLAGSRSFSNVEETTSGDSMVFSSQVLRQDKRKKTTWNIKSGRLNQGKLAYASGNRAKHKANEKLTYETSEPRRSNRRIQPTSRLLEGLQSLLLISRIPSSSHGKNHSNKGAIKGNK